MELALLGWVALGLRLKRIPFRSLLGAVPRDLRSIARTWELHLCSGLAH